MGDSVQRSVIPPQMNPASSRAIATIANVATVERLPRWATRRYQARSRCCAATR